MEPFALFNLLQSLLSGNSAENSAEKEVFSPSLPTEEPVNDAPQEPIPTPSQEAALRFLIEHENRAKRTKK